MARAAYRYDEAARRLLLPFKHADRTEYARPLARQMARVGASLLAEADLLVPVPLHWQRLLARRYNQAVLLARALSSLSGVPLLPDALQRFRRTPHLIDRSAAERASLLAQVMRVRRGAVARVAGKRIVLVDDVLTSGATARACTQVLLAAGAARVVVLAAARVPDPRLERSL